MKKFLAVLVAAFIGLLAFSTPSFATGNHDGDQPSADNKTIDICHYKGDHGAEAGKYSHTPVSISGWYNGHRDHSRDIWAAFSYTTKGGDVVNVPAQGDTSLLAFADCEAPKVDEQITKPEDVYSDVCGTENDVFSVAPGRGYTVNPVVFEGSNQVITVDLNDGFSWKPDGNKQQLRFVRPGFTNEDCGLPDTGGSADTMVGTGIGLGVAVLLIGGLTLYTTTRRRQTN